LALKINPAYEDALNNLHLRRTPEQEAGLARSSEAVRDQYLLGYFLDVEKSWPKLSEWAASWVGRIGQLYRLNDARRAARVDPMVALRHE
jgi:hypothetical protein